MAAQCTEVRAGELEAGKEGGKRRKRDEVRKDIKGRVVVRSRPSIPALRR